ncbi:MAG: acyl-CoA/acyl-ACP dehydrogenase, partial [Proteobacteria bacterium]|nr:acyl-CoA/acyl-ACP dehydrogenase [Pseudomonadota bacterium]
MDFQLSEDQVALQEGIRSFLDDRLGIEQLRELDEKGEFDRGLWAELAEMGVFGLRLPEDAGGVGLGTADAVIVFEELGRRAVPGPLVWTHLAADLVDGAASGEAVVSGLDLLAGQPEPIMIEHFDEMDALLAVRGDGVYRIDPDEVKAQAVSESLDPFTPVHYAESLPDGLRVADAERARQLRLEGAALVGGQLLGIAEETLTLANEYAKQREQFDRPIGKFQAIKHILADMFVRQEAARAAAYAGGATLDDPEVGDVQRAVSAAKLNAGEAAMKNARACIQVHGGMGFTWEIPAHFYLKRTWVLESVFGTCEEHAELVAECIEREIDAQGA